MRFAVFHFQRAASFGYRRVAVDRGRYRVERAYLHSLVGPGIRLLGRYVVFLGEIAREIRRCEILDLGVIEGLHGFHISIVHTGAAVHRELIEGHIALALYEEVARFRVSIPGIAPYAGARSVVIHTAVHVAVVQPEGHVHALYLLYPVLCDEILRQELFTLALLLKRRLCLLRAHLERYHVVRTEHSRQLRGENDLVIAVRASGSRRNGVRYNFRAA